jgi:hypothetical protein
MSSPGGEFPREVVMAEPKKAVPAVTEAAQKRAASVSLPADPRFISALLAERQGFIQRGLPERVKLVDEQLRLRGHEVTE